MKSSSSAAILTCVQGHGLPSNLADVKTDVRERAGASVSSNDAIPISRTSSRLLVDWVVNNDLSRNNTVPIAGTSGGFFIDGGLDGDVLAFGEKEDGGEGIHLL
jgi:hypothetical protein